MAEAGPQLLDAIRTSDGRTVAEMSHERPVLLVFLRHAGCPFCRKWLGELSARRAQLDAAGTALVLVHMSSDAEAAELFARYRLDDVPRISDPGQTLYAEFGLARGNAGQVIGPAVWWRGLKATLQGHLPGVPSGDVLQMPGAFLIVGGRVVRAFRAASSADEPDFDDFTTCPVTPPGGAEAS